VTSTTLRTSSRLAMVICLLGSVVSTAHADPSPPTYTLTDLGSGNITFTTAKGDVIAVPSNPLQGTSGLVTSQIASVSNGQASYAFSTTPDTILSPGQGALAGIPLAEPVSSSLSLPYVLGNPSYYTATAMGGLMNGNGIAALVDNYLSNSGSLSNVVAYYVQQNAGGSWGATTSAMVGQTTGYNGQIFVSVIGLNGANQILLGTSYPGTQYDSLVYNVNSHTLTDLATLPPFANGTYSNLLPIAIDDQGRILLQATSTSPSGWTQDTLLLTPDGVSSDPIILSAPEPSSWAVMVLAVAAFAAHRMRERRRRS
jgi:MYXO-CTERM domain-containing protein